MNISKYMPKKRDEKTTSFKIDRTLHARLKKQLKKDGYSFHDFVYAAVQGYLSEREK